MRDSPDPLRPDEEIIKLLEICLKNNTFCFDDVDYKQTNGCAMGHSYCCHYANIFLAKWEKEALAKCPLLPLFYVRFLDDIFIIWSHGKDEFVKFFNILNNHLKCIKLTYCYDEHSINFLDVTAYKGPRFSDIGIFDTKLFFKPTDSHQLLHTKSYHPKHIFRSVIKSQITRFSRICNNITDFDNACSILFNSLRKRGYSKRFLRRIKSEIRNNKYANQGLENCLGKSKPCNGLRCKLCHHINIVSSIDINNIHFEIRKDLDCNSRDIIYIINCSKCNLNYVGETSTALRTRATNHLSDIRIERLTNPVAEHFNAIPHNINSDFHITPIAMVKNIKYRKYTESSLINSFRTENPFGMNIRQDNILKQNVITPLVINYSNTNANFARNSKSLVDKYGVTKNKVIIAYKRHKNLGNILHSTK